jgi:hypothetical protein
MDDGRRAASGVYKAVVRTSVGAVPTTIVLLDSRE